MNFYELISFGRILKRVDVTVRPFWISARRTFFEDDTMHWWIAAKELGGDTFADWVDDLWKSPHSFMRWYGISNAKKWMEDLPTQSLSSLPDSSIPFII